MYVYQLECRDTSLVEKKDRENAGFFQSSDFAPVYFYISKQLKSDVKLL